MVLALVAIAALSVTKPAWSETPPAKISSSNLRVSATILPKTCDLSKPCESKVQRAYRGAGRVSVDGSNVQYLGSRPIVYESTNTLLILL